MAELKTINILQKYKVALNSHQELLELAIEAMQTSVPFRVVTFNPEMLVAAENDQSFAEAVRAAQAIIPDGIGLVLLLKKLGVKNVSRVPGIEFAQALLQKAAVQNFSVALLGSSEESLQGTKNKFSGLNYVYVRNGFFDEVEEEKIINELVNLQPNLLLVAMPFKRQEKLLQKAYAQGLRSVSLGVGGSFDVWSGNVKRAPEVFQRFGIEWLWRVLGQPQRISRIIEMALPFGQIYLKAKL